MNYRIPLPNISFSPPVYSCRKNSKPFTLDGNIHKDFWADIPYTEEFRDISGPGFPVPRFTTRAKMCWDNDNLYISALLEGDEIWAHVTERDDVIFQDNDFEIFVDPDSDTQVYYEFEMNARNTVWDLLLTRAYHDEGTPVNSMDIKGLGTAVHIDGELNNPSAQNRSWSVEVVFPFETFLEGDRQKRRPDYGDYWRVNFSRVQWQVRVENGRYEKLTQEDGQTPLPEDNWVWSPTGVVNIHYPELWGFLFFTENGEDMEIPEYEKMKWELRKFYYLEHMHYDKYGHFTNSPDDLRKLPGLPEGYELELPVTLEATSNLFEVSCRLPEQNAEAYVLWDGRTGVRTAPSQ